MDVIRIFLTVIEHKNTVLLKISHMFSIQYTPLGLLECAETMLFVSLWSFLSLSSDSLTYISFHDSYS